MSYQPVIEKSYLTEIEFVNAPVAGLQQKFLDIPMLRGVKTQGLQCFMETQLTKSPNGKTTVGIVTGLVLTLTEDTTEKMYQFPVFDLVSANNSGLIRMIKNKIWNLPKSYITVLDATGLAVNESVLFNFIYTGEPSRQS